jgi:site-specific recombinase XerD
MGKPLKTLKKKSEQQESSGHSSGHRGAHFASLDTVRTHFSSLSVRMFNTRYTAILFLRTDAKREDGQCPVWLSCYINSERVRFSTDVSCAEWEWDANNKKIKGRSPVVSDKNLMLSGTMAQINKIFTNARLRNRMLTVAEFKKQFFNPVSEESFVQFYQAQMNERLRLKIIVKSTWKADNKTLQKIMRFDNGVRFSELTPEWCKKFNAFLQTAYDNKVNTRHNDFKRIKTYVNMAIDKGVEFDNPFKKFRVPRTASQRVFLERHEVKQLEQLYQNPSLSERHHKCLRAFLFQIYTSLRDSDVKRIEQSNIVNNELVFMAWKTRRTEKIVKVPLTENAVKFISSEKNRLVESYCNQVQNRYLKEIAVLAAINKRLSTHCGRHTFATMFLESKGSLEVLQEIMGHTSITTTMVYAHIVDKRRRTEMDGFNDYMKD